MAEPQWPAKASVDNLRSCRVKMMDLGLRLYQAERVLMSLYVPLSIK